MDLTSMLPGGAGEEQAPEQRLSKEEYAAMKKQQREEVWAAVSYTHLRKSGSGMYYRCKRKGKCTMSTNSGFMVFVIF